jgi:beta-lactamase class A
MFLAASAAAVALHRPVPVRAAGSDGIAAGVLGLFDPLPGDKAVKIWSPAAKSGPELLVQSNTSAHLFVGSAIKAFVLCERMRQLDDPNIVAMLTTTQVALDASVWSADSRTLNPPFLSGEITERTAMEAMIMHSDNTGTDIEFKQTGPDNVRGFLAKAGLTNSAVPDSTRIFFGYLLGAPDYKTYTWEELSSLPDNAPFVNSPLNSVETLASSGDDLVSFYARSLQGEFFRNSQTLDEYRRILTLGDAATLAPNNVKTFSKGGSIDVPGFHCLCIPGAMAFNDRWVYYAFIINWYDVKLTDPDTVAAFIDTTRKALALTRDGLSAGCA